MATFSSTTSTDNPAAVLDAKLKKLKTAEQEQLIHQQAQDLGLAYIDLHQVYIKPSDVKIITKETALKLAVVSYFKGSNIIKLGALQPRDPQIQNIAAELKQKYNAEVTVALISADSFKKALTAYEQITVQENKQDLKISEAEIVKFTAMIGGLKSVKEYIYRLNITEILNLILAAALKSSASDIHLEPQAQICALRFRIDGVLHNVAELPVETGADILKRIKLIAGLKINVANKPQDGRFSLIYLNERVDLRVSALPSAYGESLVLRLLGKSEQYFQFNKLGLKEHILPILEAEIKKPNGLILSCGPTGSGKTTTLYAILNKLNEPESKIITLEDPIEYKLAGIIQTQVEADKGYNFAAGLRSILRQDPDIIMVGEIRDFETADTAVNSALTGHLVLSTVHTNTAAGAIPRLLSMGVKPFLLAPALNVIIGQRLVRLLCPQCKKKARLSREVLLKVKEILRQLPAAEKQNVDFKNLKFWQSSGCAACNDLGFRGRLGIFEILPIVDDLEQIVLQAELSEYKIRQAAKEQGMATMVQDGLLKALAGITSVEEVFRVAQ